MKPIGILPYFANTFWLLVPPLAFNIVFVKYLPHFYQKDVFWKDIPTWIGMPENLLRLLVFLLPMVMRLRTSTPNQKLGLWLYVVGTLIYFAAWGAQIAFPKSKWSISKAGFMAPAYTPVLWLSGIGLIGDTLTIPKMPYSPWVYWCLAGMFLVFHNVHTWLVHSKVTR